MFVPGILGVFLNILFYLKEKTKILTNPFYEIILTVVELFNVFGNGHRKDQTYLICKTVSKKAFTTGVSMSHLRAFICVSLFLKC